MFQIKNSWLIIEELPSTFEMKRGGETFVPIKYPSRSSARTIGRTYECHNM